MRKKLVGLLVLSELLAGQGLCPRAQETAEFADVHLYDEVLDRLFPVGTQNTKPGVVIRFAYGPAQEVQISITGEAGEEKYEVWRVPPGKASIWNQVADLQSRLRTSDPQVIAASIRVEHLMISHPSEGLRQTRKQFDQLRFAPSLNEGLVLDGWQYDLWFHSQANSVHFSLAGPPGGESSHHPLIKWMASLRRALEATHSK